MKAFTKGLREGVVVSGVVYILIFLFSGLIKYWTLTRVIIGGT